MSRVKRGVTSHAKHKKVYKLPGFSRPAQDTIRTAKAAVGRRAIRFRDRKRKSAPSAHCDPAASMAAVRPLGMTYSVFINALPSQASRSNRKCCRISPSTSRGVQAIAEKAKARWRRNPQSLQRPCTSGSCPAQAGIQ